MSHYEVIVIGGGPAGYTAAIKLSQLGKKVACVEMRDRLGGTCLNVGCIPSKALLQSSHKFHEAKNMEEFGVMVKDVSLSLKKMMERKNSIVNDLAKGIDGLFKKNKVSRIIGIAKFVDAKRISVTHEGKEQIISADNIIIATGSQVTPLEGVVIDESRIVSSTGALELDYVPKKMVVIGGGVIGLEMGSVWSRLGSEVTVIEYGSRILGGMDEDISREAHKIFSAQGLKFMTDTRVLGTKAEKDKAIIQLESKEGDKKEVIEADIILSAAGRISYTDGLGLASIGVKTNVKNMIEVDSSYRTNISGIYAIGDVIKGPMLAHKAEEEGIAVAEIIGGQHGHVNYNAIPGIVYTHPEIASVGRSEADLKKDGIEYNVGKFPFMANSRARTNGESLGFAKILSDKKTDRILGAQIIGANAGDLMAELVIAMEFGASSEDVARTSHGHPSLSEAIKEAAMASYDKPIHI